MGAWDTNFIQNTTVIRTGGHVTECPADQTGTLRHKMIPVKPGRPYRVAVGLRQGAGAVNGQDDMNAYVEWFTTAEVSISTDDVFAMGILAADNTWYDFDLVIDSPATAGFCQLVWDVDGSANSVAHYKDYLSIVEAPYGFSAVIALGGDSVADADHIVFDDEVYDYGGVYDGTDTFTAKVAGVHSFSAWCVLDDIDIDDVAYLELDFSGAPPDVAGTQVQSTTNAHAVRIAVGTTLYLTAGTTVNVKIKQDTGGNQTALAGGRFSGFQVE